MDDEQESTRCICGSYMEQLGPDIFPALDYAELHRCIVRVARYNHQIHREKCANPVCFNAEFVELLDRMDVMELRSMCLQLLNCTVEPAVTEEQVVASMVRYFDVSDRLRN